MHHIASAGGNALNLKDKRVNKKTETSKDWTMMLLHLVSYLSIMGWYWDGQQDIAKKIFQYNTIQ